MIRWPTIKYGLSGFVAANCTVINTALRQLTGLFPDLNISIVAIVRGEDAFVPNSSDEMFAGDEVYFIADTEHVGRALATFGYEERQEASRRITIIGGGNIGLNLARFIQDMENVTGRIIESDSTRARRIVSTLHDTQVTHGDALDTEILEETNIQNADTVVAVSNDDETNILASLLAKRFGVERTIALVNQDTCTPLVTTLGIDVVNPGDNGFYDPAAYPKGRSGRSIRCRTVLRKSSKPKRSIRRLWWAHPLRK